jgi:hypothetical protein
VGVEEVAASEPHAPSVMTSAAAPTTSMRQEEARDEFTVCHATDALSSPCPVVLRCRQWVHGV